MEYYSRTMSGWVLSYVKGVNPDGTYKLNTKKSADPRLMRTLLEEHRTPLVSIRTIQQPSQFRVSLIQHPLKFGRPVDLTLHKAEIFSLLGLPGNWGMTRMEGFTGGQNEGIWFVSNGSDKVYCLKIVGSRRKFASVPSECENYVELLNRFPAITRDKNLTFPIRILSMSDQFDIFVMPVARGGRMAELISRILLCDDESRSQLRSLFIAVGSELRRFHAKYSGTQHGDLQTSNIYVDSNAGVCFIDVGGMGMKGLGKSDVEYFLESINLLARTYGAEFERVATASFVQGYTL